MLCVKRKLIKLSYRGAVLRQHAYKNMEGKSDARDELPAGPQSLRHERDHVRKVMAAEAREKCVQRDRHGVCAWSDYQPGTRKTLFKEFNDCLSQYTTEEEFEDACENMCHRPERTLATADQLEIAGTRYNSKV